MCTYVFEDSEDSTQNEVHVVHAPSLAWCLDAWRNTTISDAPTEIWIKEGLQGLELQYVDVLCCSFKVFFHVIFMLFALSAAKSIRVQQPALFSSCNHGAGAALLVSKQKWTWAMLGPHCRNLDSTPLVAQSDPATEKRGWWNQSHDVTCKLSPKNKNTLVDPATLVGLSIWTTKV